MPRALADFGVEGGLAATVALVGVQALPIALPQALAGWAVRRGVPRPLALGLAWGACIEPIAAVQPLPFPPTLLLAAAPWLAAPAAFGGLALAAGVAMGVGAALHRPAGWAGLAAWGLSGLAMRGGPAPTLEVAVVQPDLGVFDARRVSTAEARAARIDALVRSRDADLVVLPEGAWPHDPGTEGSHARRAALQAWVDWPPTVVGATQGDPPANTLLAVAGGTVVDRFDKQILVPLTERPLFGWGARPWRPGIGARRLDLAGVRLGPLVCYEDLFPTALRAAHAAGSEVLLAATNDGWTADGPGSDWHLAAARTAAVTTGRWLLRPTTSGVSAVVAPSGHLIASAPWVDGDREASPGTVLPATVAARVPRWGCGACRSPWLAGLAALGLGLLSTTAARRRPLVLPQEGGT